MKTIFIFSILLFTKVWLFAQETPFVSNSNFQFEKFDKSRIDVGTLYIYEYSNNEKNFEPSSMEYFYIKTLSNVENIGVDIGVDKEDTLNLLETFFKYKLNWDYMMLEQQEYISLKNENDIPIGYAFKIKRSIDFKRKTFDDSTYGREKNGFQHFHKIWKFESIPTYFYRYTYLVPLWFALRFYPLNKKMITVNSMTGNYNIKFEIKYEGKEKVKVPFGKVLSYKFELIPKLSFFMKIFSSPKKAFIWLSAENNYRYMVKYRNNNKVDNNPSIEYQLVERKKMTPEEWEQFKEKHGAKDTNFTN